MKLAYNVKGIQRRELVKAISEELHISSEYFSAPTYKYEVGKYTIDREGTVTGPDNRELVSVLCERHGLKAVCEEYDEPQAETDALDCEGLVLTESEELGLGGECREDPQDENDMSANDVPAELADNEPHDLQPGEPEMSMVDRFAAWLKGDDSGAFYGKDGGATVIVTRIAANDDFDYLFTQRVYGSDVLSKSALEYAGLYHKPSALVYEVGYNLRDFVDQGYECRSASQLRKGLRDMVRCMVENRVNNNRANLTITALSSTDMIQRHEEYKEYYAHTHARKAYVEGHRMDDMVFHCKYMPSSSWDDAAFMQYVAEPEAFALNTAEQYMRENQEDFLYDFLITDAVKAAYTQFTVAPSANIHAVKGIYTAMNASEAKSVMVTIFRDDCEFRFKCDAAPLRRDPGEHYSTYMMAYPDRKRFADRFGKNAEVRPEEITKIEYARKTLYAAE
jgi:hypothetical protein